MSSIALKRIKNDMKIIRTSNLDEQNIYVSFDEANIYNAKALIIGPYIENSPYQGGFYLFDITFPTNYPLSPPKVEFKTTNNCVRFNPNLYKCGKVCLSILNTWSGPGWTSAQNLMSVLLSIQSLLHDNPIQNEPGWENENGIKSKNYNILLAYYNIKVAVIQMVNNIPEGFEIFSDLIKDYLKKNKEKYDKVIEDYYEYNGDEFSSCFMLKMKNYNIKDIHLQFNELIKNLI